MYLLVILLLMALSPYLMADKIGILARPIGRSGSLFGEAGQVVNYTPALGTSGRHDIWVNVKLGDRLIKQVQAKHVLPDDADFVMSWAYLQLSSQKLVRPGHAKAVEQGCEYARQAYLLARNVRRRYPDHVLAEPLAYLECYFIKRWEGCHFEGKTLYERSKGCYERYLSDFPDGEHIVRIRWDQLVTENTGYDCPAPGDHLQVAESAVKFVSKHPEVEFESEILFYAAHHFWWAWVDATYGRGDSCGDVTEEQGEAAKQKALDICQKLMESKDRNTRLYAKAVHYDLTQGKRTSDNSNAWGNYWNWTALVEW